MNSSFVCPQEVASTISRILLMTKKQVTTSLVEQQLTINPQDDLQLSHMVTHYPTLEKVKIMVIATSVLWKIKLTHPSSFHRKCLLHHRGVRSIIFLDLVYVTRSRLDIKPCLFVVYYCTVHCDLSRSLRKRTHRNRIICLDLVRNKMNNNILFAHISLHNSYKYVLVTFNSSRATPTFRSLSQPCIK